MEKDSVLLCWLYTVSLLIPCCMSWCPICHAGLCWLCWDPNSPRLTVYARCLNYLYNYNILAFSADSAMHDPTHAFKVPFKSV